MQSVTLLRILLTATLLVPGALAQTLPANAASKIDAILRRSLARDGTPSVSVAVVANDTIVYARAFGSASLVPARPATAATKYQLASISKSFTAQAILLLEADGKLSLDDHLDRWFPELTAARTITVQQLLSHTAGEPDHYPEGYPAGPKGHATTPDAILAEWAHHPLLSTPGERFRYDNLDYVIAGRIVEQASGMPLFQFLQQRIFAPLGMHDVLDLDRQQPSDTSVATGYVQVALAPLQPAPYEGPGWSFGAGQVVTTARDVALWDLAFLHGTLLPPQQAREEVTPTRLNDGSTVPYALGLYVSQRGGTRRVYHSGGGLGFLTLNDIYPDAHIAIVILTNTSPKATVVRIDEAIRSLLVPPTPQEAFAQALFIGLQHGTPNRTLFTADLNSYLQGSVLKALHTSLAALGPIESFIADGGGTTDGLETRDYDVTAAGRQLHMHLLLLPNGKLQDLSISPVEQ